MLTWGQIEQLTAFEAGEVRVLSVYLDLGRCHLDSRSYLTAFRNLVLRKSERVEVLERRALLREAASVQTWLASAEVTGSGLAAFSCAAEGLWQREFLQVRLPNHLAYERRVDLAPFVEVLQNTSRALRDLLPQVLSDRQPTIMGGGPVASELETLARALEGQRRLELAIEARKLANRMDARLAKLLRPARSRAGQE